MSSTRPQVSIQWCAMLAVALDGLGCAMTKASQTFLVEQALCRAFYATRDPAVIGPDGAVPEALCKIESLQSQVALLACTLDFSILITCFLASPIYTRLASLIGKRNVLLLNTTSFALRMVWYTAVFYFHNTIKDVRWVLLSCIFDLVGGGIPVREILFYLYVAESVPEHGMTGTFNLLTAILIGMMSLGTFVGARLLKVNVFVTCVLIIGVYVLLVPLVALFPHHQQPSSPTYNTEEEASIEECRTLMSADTMGATATSHSPPPGREASPRPRPQESAPTVFRSLLRAATVDLYLSIDLVIQTVRHTFTRHVMMLYFGSTLADVISMTTLQWASGTFHVSLSDVNQVTAMEQIVSTLTLLALPLLSRHVLRPRLHTKEAVDFCIIKLSLLMTLVGVLVIAEASSLATYAMGVAIAATGIGLSDALRSFATSALSNQEAVQRLYMSIRTVQTLAAMAGTPLWSGFFLWILSNPGLPRGLLYLGNACVVFVCLLLTRFLQPTK